MKMTPIRITSEFPLIEEGTGRYKGEEVYPNTPTLLKKLGISKIKIEEIAKLQHITKDVGSTLYKDLRPYQLEDVKFLFARKNAACFNEQRTGKTPTAISTFRARGLKKVLIVAPASALYQWKQEWLKWHNTDAVVVDGTASKRKEIIKSWVGGALIIGYECLRETVRTTANEIKITGDVNEIKKHKDIEGIIVDEAHRIKNHKSKQANALFSLDYIPYKLALTGTPAPGKPWEIFSILHFLYPTIFTGYWRFINYYFEQQKRWGAYGDFKEIVGFRRGKDKELQEFLAYTSTRRLRASVMSWLPEKDRQQVILPTTKEQAAYIKELRETFEIQDGEINTINVLSRLMKERQLCLAPKTLDLKSESPKLNWIKQYLEDYPDKAVIIFSNFTSWLKHLGKELGIEYLIVGEVSKKERELLKQKFQSGKIRVLLINIQAGKEALTLDRADTIIFTDKYPPVGAIQQAEDRFIATNKDMLKYDHTIISLIMEGTYEVNIEHLLNNNAEEVDIINNYQKYLKGDKLDVHN